MIPANLRGKHRVRFPYPSECLAIISGILKTRVRSRGCLLREMQSPHITSNLLWRSCASLRYRSIVV